MTTTKTIRNAVLQAWGAAECNPTDTIDMVICTLIAAIEEDKGRVRVELEELNSDYHRGRYRQHGMTKQQTEHKLARLNGEVLGFERALSYLYATVSNDE